MMLDVISALDGNIRGPEPRMARLALRAGDRPGGAQLHAERVPKSLSSAHFAFPTIFIRRQRLPASGPCASRAQVLVTVRNLTESREFTMNASGIAEMTYAASDHLELHVQRRLGSRVRDLRVLIRQDGVILQGRAGTYHAK